MSEWLPIDTAPKDGTQILGWDGTYRTTCYWYCPKWLSYPNHRWILVAPGAYAEDGDWEPTHWHPLPEPPK